MHRKILIFSLAYYPVEGGAEIAVKEITGRITNADFDLITLRFSKEHLAQEKVGNVNVFRINSSKTLFPFKAFFLASKLHKEKHYDLTWAIMANWAGLSAMFFKYRFPDTPYILTLQEGDPIDFIKKKVYFIWPIFKKIFTKADKIQVISNFLKDFARSVGYMRGIEVIPNGVDVEKFQRKIENLQPITNIVLITAGRLVKKNGVGDIIEALKYLPNNVRFLSIGAGPLEEELRAKVLDLGLGNRVEFRKNVFYYKVPKYLHEADIFVRPSLSEGFGNSFIEAMAAGLPVIATSVGGIVDFLKDGETGLFCKVKNPESIAEQVKRLIENKDLSQALVENALKMVKEHYEWDLIAREMDSRVFNI